MGRVDGKVAFITGAARGQGRSHAVRLAEEGADIIAIDLCGPVDSVRYPMPTPDDLAETVRQVEALDRRIVSRVGDARDQEALDDVVAAGIAEFGRLDIAAINHGIVEHGDVAWKVEERQWQDTIDINLTGVWKSAKAAIPAMITAGNGGSVVITSSFAGLNGVPNASAYSSAKHGVVGLMRSLANELGPHEIRVNSVHPGNVNTDMLFNEVLYKLFRPDLEDPQREDVMEVLESLPLLPIAYEESIDISNAVLFLASDEARYVTGIEVPVDAGWNVRALR